METCCIAERKWKINQSQRTNTKHSKYNNLDAREKNQTFCVQSKRISDMGSLNIMNDLFNDDNSKMC